MGVGIFSRLPVLSRRDITLEARVQRGQRMLYDARSYVEMTIQIGGQELIVGTTHLPFHPRFRSTAFKLQMVETLLRQSQNHERHILASDLNAVPYGKAAKTLRSSGLRNIGSALDTPTWTTKSFSIEPWSYDALQWRLDYVLGKGVKPINARLPATTLSDHVPQLISFLI